MAIIIYHNPRCSKSRIAVNYLQENDYEFSIIEYLNNPPSAEELTNILAKLKISARQLLRTGEAEYKENNLKDLNLPETEIINFMSQYPKLIERPIIIKDQQACIARPLDNLINMLENQ
jgi:arsenate reductase (glutaredoxin)